MMTDTDAEFDAEIAAMRKVAAETGTAPVYRARREFRGDYSMTGMEGTPRCLNCGLYRREHINSVFCPEWRLRQLDGDR